MRTPYLIDDEAVSARVVGLLRPGDHRRGSGSGGQRGAVPCSKRLPMPQERSGVPGRRSGRGRRLGGCGARRLDCERSIEVAAPRRELDALLGVTGKALQLQTCVGSEGGPAPRRGEGGPTDGREARGSEAGCGRFQSQPDRAARARVSPPLRLVLLNVSVSRQAGSCDDVSAPPRRCKLSPTRVDLRG